MRAQQLGNLLIVSDAREETAGTYMCMCVTADGNTIVSEYVLTVLPPSVAGHPDRQRPGHQPAATTTTTPSPAPKRLLNGHVEHSDIGTSVTLYCDQTEYRPQPGAQYQWTRQHGKFNGQLNTTSVSVAKKKREKKKSNSNSLF